MHEQRITPDEWPAATAAVDGPQLVVGGPGTGKTEFVVRRVRHLVGDAGVASDRIVALAFGRRGVADLADRIRMSFPTAAPPIHVVTFHSLSAGIVDRHATERGWSGPPQILTGPEQAALVRELLAVTDPAAWSPAFRGLLGSSTFADEVTDFVLRAGEQMLDERDLARMAVDRADWRGLPEFVAGYRRELKRRGRIDYGSLLAEACAIAEEEPAVAARYDYVLVDEFQDTTLAQVRLLAALTASHRNLTVVADPYQSIYSFRGAAVQNVARFPHQFRDAAGNPARRVVLTTSFRTPEAVLRSAERVTSHDLPGAAGPVTPAPGAGRVDVHVFEQQTAEAEWIAAEAVRLHLEAGMPYRRMAVFVRSTRRFAPELSRALHRRRIPHDPPAARLAEQPAARFLLDLVTAATGAEPDAVRAIRRILLGPWFTIPLGALRQLERQGAAAGMTWTDAMRAFDDALTPVAALIDDPAWASESPALDGAWQVWSTVPQLAVVATDAERKDERAAWSSLVQVLGRWNERNPHGTLTDYQRLVEAEDFEARPLLSYATPDRDQLTVTTLHQAKGLEFDVVFIADAVEGVFPDLRMRDSLLGVRHLLPDIPTDAAAYRRFRLQEERRLAYTAMTRASQRVVWTATSTGFEGGRGVPSRFLALVAGTATVAAAATPPVGDRSPVTPAEAEARLRQVVADPAQPRARRLAALDVLGRGPRWGLRDPWRFGGMRSFGPDVGLNPPSVRLSPTDADAYAQCPRRFAVMRRLGIGDRVGPHAQLGRVLHAAIEDAEQAALDAGAPRGSLDDALEALAMRFEPDDFGGEPHATAWMRRAAVALKSLYDRWPSSARVVAVEHPLRHEIGGVPWTGRVDRIELQGSALRIVDFKTGSTVASNAEAAESLQLGFYLLAASHDPALTKLGTPTGAEFWYPYASRARKTISRRTFDATNLDEVEVRLAAAADGITSEAWPATPSAACERCPVRIVCPAQPEGAEGFVP